LAQTPKRLSGYAGLLTAIEIIPSRNSSLLPLALTGSMEEARAAALAGFALDPGFTIRRTKGLALNRDPTFRAGSKRIREGMLLAGIPDE
jgi:hypothetical protein